MKIYDSFYHKIKFIFQERIQLIFGKHYLKNILRFKNFNFLSKYFIFTPLKFNKNNDINILFQNKGVFNEEVIHLFKNHNKVNLIRLNRPFLKQLLNFTYGEKKINHLNWLEKSKDLKKRNIYQSYLKRFIGNPDISLLIVFNWGDGSTAELSEYLKKYNIPTICLHKEGIMSNIFRENYLNILKNKRIRFNGHKLLVYNKITKDTFIDSGYSSELIEIVGSVRFDDIFNLRKSKIDQKKIVLFHPSINAQLPDLLGINYDFNWSKIVNKFYQTLEKLIINLPHYTFTLKIKTRDNLNIKKYLNKNFKNLIIDNHTSSISLLKNAKLCIGFNTTALIESAAFGIPTINFISKNNLEKFLQYVIDYKSLVVHSDQYEMIKEFALNTSQRKNLDIIKKNDFEEIIGNNNGKAKDRIVNSILKTINYD